MTPIRNSTSATSVTDVTGLRQAFARGFGGLRGPLVAVTLVAFCLRALRLEWQPLWWDEGYSVFFATEPLAKMLALTAQDIHPPLYYALLHLWTLLLGSARPGVIRLLSVYAGVPAVPLLGVLAYMLTRRRGVAVLAACLLALNPLHVYYSQEVRMYSLALLLGLASTYALVKLAVALDAGAPVRGKWFAWIVLNALLLYTLYYAAFLVVAQFIWLGIGLRRKPRALLALLTAAAAMALLCMPWWLFALPKLAAYIGGKVQSDQDVPLGPLAYSVRHLLAFSMGHVRLDNLALPARAFAYVGVIAALPALLTLRKAARRHSQGPSAINDAPGLLWTLVLVPSLLAFLLNLRFPFFPEGGERLLLFVLPYYLLLISLGIFSLQPRSLWRAALLTPLLAAGAVGVAAFFTVPRYVEDDYRPIIAQVMQQGGDDDSVLALFPWQVGYWRAYSPIQTDGRLLSPQPAPVGQGALVWSSPMQDAIDAALRRGVLWFPEPVSLGSTLPAQIEAYLQDAALNVENRWYGAATRLTAWTALPPGAPLLPVAADFGPLTLDAAWVTPHAVPSANAVLAVTLQWTLDADPGGMHVTLRLRDDAGRDWAGRDYAPPGRFAAQTTPAVEPGAAIITDTLSLLVPPGLPPGEYTLFVTATEATGDALPLAPAQMHPLAQIAVSNPLAPLSPHRLPVDYPARWAKAAHRRRDPWCDGAAHRP